MRILPRHLLLYLSSTCRHPKKWTLSHIFRAFFIAIISISIIVALYYHLIYQDHQQQSQQRQEHSKSYPNFRLTRHKHQQERQEHEFKNPQNKHGHKNKPFFRLLPWSETPIIAINSSTNTSKSSSSPLLINNKCSLFTCFDIHRCGGGDIGPTHRLSIYLYPLKRYIIDGVELPPPSKPWLEIIDALRRSEYWVESHQSACILIPTIDTLAISDEAHAKRVTTALNSLSFWNSNGQNHLLFSFFTHSNLNNIFQKFDSILASSSFSSHSYRPGFHINLLLPNLLPNQNQEKMNNNNNKNYNQKWFKERNFIAISPTDSLLIPDDDPNILVLDYCSKDDKEVNYWKRCSKKVAPHRIFDYPAVLKATDFCLLPHPHLLTTPLLHDVMSSSCIPVIILSKNPTGQNHPLPFDDVLDWSRFSILLYHHQIHEISSILRGIGEGRKNRLKSQLHHIFNQHLKNLSSQVSTLLEVCQDRIFSHYARPLSVWNHHPSLDLIEQPLFNPSISRDGSSSFTAVILAYDRLSSLFQVINTLDKVPSLSKILVVWNNQKSHPPSSPSFWPSTNKSISVVEMSSNKMSNRFWPFEEIETEAVLSLDDDIIMLTKDEIEFGFQTWKEFPDRLVGFPSRTHIWDNTTHRWRYESEWTNQISMVLTGAAFYHKYWHYAYTHEMPKEIREIVDDKMNCEDIALNFLVAATTGQPPIKVTPRKKFKCPTCSNNEMLSSDSTHMMERNDCLNRFSGIYGFMPLIEVEWRADPVLYRNGDGLLSSKLVKFKHVGTI